MPLKHRFELPFMKGIDDAVSFSIETGDNFYVTAFMMQAWLGSLVARATAEYAEQKKASERDMQSGQAWAGFQKTFERATDAEFPHVFECLLRFAEHEGSLSELLRDALIPLSLEHDCLAEFAGPKTFDEGMPHARAVRLMRQTLERLCDWIDAVIHERTHTHWHLAPLAFDPTPDKRELAALGINQRHFAEMSELSRAHWVWHHGQAAEEHKGSPKWMTVGKAMASGQTRHWSYPILDRLVISLWPLVKRYNWTYREFLKLVRRAVPRPTAYPCECEQDFATFCRNVLGLRKSRVGRTSQNGPPSGWEVGLRLIAGNQRAGSS